VALLIATLDTKGEEARFVRDALRQQGVDVAAVDAGSLGPPLLEAEYPREAVFSGPIPPERGEAVAAAAEGVTRLAVRLHNEGRLAGVLGLGGSAGTVIATAAMRALPVGVPKVMVSTLASGQVRPYVGLRDVCMIHSVVDLAGLNQVSRPVLWNAAQAMAGMVRCPVPRAEPLPVLAATMFGVTTPCVEAARRELEAAGKEVLVFHATGVGGRTMESLIADGTVQGVLDVTTTELADELVGGVLSAGPDRLRAAAKYGVPQVVSVGALDMVNFGPMDTVPERLRGRRLHVHNPSVTLMRTTPEENAQLGEWIGERVSASTGPASVFVPRKGVSALDREGGPFWWPEADAALFAALRASVRRPARLVEMDCHINDDAFAREMAKALLAMVSAQ
jgi:uncharacterized protein (UPF0261 family)